MGKSVDLGGGILSGVDDRGELTSPSDRAEDERNTC